MSKPNEKKKIVLLHNYTNPVLIKHMIDAIWMIHQGYRVSGFDSKWAIEVKLNGTLIRTKRSLQKQGIPYNQPKLEDTGLPEMVFEAIKRDEDEERGAPFWFELLDVAYKHRLDPLMLLSTCKTFGIHTYNNFIGPLDWVCAPVHGRIMINQVKLYHSDPKPCLGRIGMRTRMIGECGHCKLRGLCDKYTEHFKARREEKLWKRYADEDRQISYLMAYAQLVVEQNAFRLLGCWAYESKSLSIMKMRKKAGK